MPLAVLKTEKELREIFSHLKNLVKANQEIGMDPPPISNKALKYLMAQPPEIPDNADRLNGLESLQTLREYIGACRRCKLFRGRTHLVFGEGSPKARLVFIGEGPGQEEDKAGRPFIGEAGRLLTRIIAAMGLTREEVYICNVVKCHPPKNRDPEKDEITTCIPFLRKQLNIINPDVICVLGRIAGMALMGKDFKITSQRGKWLVYDDIPTMPTFHPAYILRNPRREREIKAQVWEDMQKIMQRLGLEVKSDA